MNPKESYQVSDELWSKIQPLLPRHVNRHRFGGGRPRADDRQCMNGILFVLRTGCQWNALNATGICPSSTAHDRFQEIIDDANRPDSPIRLQTVVLDPTELGQKTVTVVSQPLLATKLGLKPQQVAGAIVLAPHIMVEDLSVASIEQARQAYLATDLRQRLARHHDDPDSAFWGWNRIWLHPPFRHWSIEDEIAAITCPLLAVQGLDDEYGTLEQIRGIARRVPQTQLLELADCGHSPQRDQPDQLLEAATTFLRG